jgi:hypothetical protein
VVRHKYKIAARKVRCMITGMKASDVAIVVHVVVPAYER